MNSCTRQPPVLAQAKVPSSIASALMSARLTALVKTGGGVRSVATGCSLRRLVARAPAKQFSSHFEEECAPFQHALSTRAGTDCVGHLLRAATDATPTATVLSVDGIGAFDHVLSEVGHVEQVGIQGALEKVSKSSVRIPRQYLLGV